MRQETVNYINRAAQAAAEHAIFVVNGEARRAPAGVHEEVRYTAQMILEEAIKLLQDRV